MAAAREVFAERGVDVALEEIARRAGVSIGTLYNRFPTRAHLIDAVFAGRFQATERIADQALAMDDPWEGFVFFQYSVFELQAADRGYNDLASRCVAGAKATEEAKARGHELIKQVFDRAQETGALRPDVTLEDMTFLIWGHARTVEATGAIAPRAWRRHLAIMLDGLRAPAAHPLPEPPLEPEEVQRAMRGLCG
jgi:AcrR family transcriptional regulator